MNTLHRTFFGLLLLVLLGLASPHSVGATSGWLAVYWNNTDLSGSPILMRPEYDDNHNPDLDINWGLGSPDPSINKEYFSGRWTRSEYLEPGRYRFTATADDGVRLWVNDQLLIDAWYNQPLTTYTAYIDLEGGFVSIKVEYYENQHDARVRVNWTHVPGSDVTVTGSAGWGPVVTGWRGEYYNNPLFAGPPNFVRDDPEINFNWGLDSPAPHAVIKDRFAVRWTNTLNLTPGQYRFTTTSDDGVRLWVSEGLVIDQWHSQTSLSHTAVLDLSGAIPVKLEYFDEIGLAEARLTWEQIDGEDTAVAITTVPSSPSGSAPGPQNLPVGTVINANYLNVRRGPGMTFGPFTHLNGGQTVILIGRDGTTAWIQIQLPDGRYGWVANGYLNSTYPFVSLPITIE